MAVPKLSGEQIEAALHELPGWTIENSKLHRVFKFADFAHAFGFMAIAAIQVDKRDHHPEWLNVYNRVTVDLSTHDAGGITSKDVELARLLDGIAARLA